jgi:hypothetical protein
MRTEQHKTAERRHQARTERHLVKAALRRNPLEVTVDGE